MSANRQAPSRPATAHTRTPRLPDLTAKSARASATKTRSILSSCSLQQRRPRAGRTSALTVGAGGRGGGNASTTRASDRQIGGPAAELTSDLEKVKEQADKAEEESAKTVAQLAEVREELEARTHEYEEIKRWFWENDTAAAHALMCTCTKLYPAENLNKVTEAHGDLQKAHESLQAAYGELQDTAGEREKACGALAASLEKEIAARKALEEGASKREAAAAAGKAAAAAKNLPVGEHHA